MRRQNILLEFIFLSILISLGVKQSYSIDIYGYTMAQSYCASVESGWVFAIRRNCWKAPTCADMCKNAEQKILASISNQRNTVHCVDAFRINHPFLKGILSGKVNLATYGYGSGGCSWRPNHCGPNYCCCQAIN